MNYADLAVPILMAGLIYTAPISTFAADNSGTNETQKNGAKLLEEQGTEPVSGEEKEEQKQQSIDVQKKMRATPLDPPVYKPPLRGAPGYRVGGGSRGHEGASPNLSVLAPDHIGLTFQEQPVLYWYLLEPVNERVEITLIDGKTVDPLLEVALNTPIKAGMHSIRLAEHGIRLSPGKQYRWFVALVPDINHRAKDSVAGGAIERIKTSQDVRTELEQATQTEIPYIYAQAGIWYDALSAISDLIDAAPNDRSLREQRASLLKQVGLAEVAEDEIRLHGSHGP